MQWSEMLAERTLADLPYKIEQDRWGNVVISPASKVSEEGGVRYFGADGEVAISCFGIDPAPVLGH